MKHVQGLFRVCLVALVTTALACSDGVVEPRASEQDKVIEQIRKLGFQVDGVVDRGEYFVVEGDIALNKADLRRVRERRRSESPSSSVGPRGQYHTNQLASIAEVQSILTCVDTYNTGWDNAPFNAMWEWSYVPGTSIQFLSELCFMPVDLRVQMDESLRGSNFVALADFPVDAGPGKVGSRIRINPDYNFVYSEGVRNSIIAHEFGHVLGFRHDNAVNLEQYAQGHSFYGANRVPGTPVEDRSSVMIRDIAQVGRSWAGMPRYDRVAARYMYPGTRPMNLNGNTNNGRPWINWSTEYDVTSYRIYAGYIGNPKASFRGSVAPGTPGGPGAAGSSIAFLDQNATVSAGRACSASPSPTEQMYFLTALYDAGTAGTRESAPSRPMCYDYILPPIR